MTPALETTALSDHIGVEVRGLDPRALPDAAIVRALGTLLGRHHLLLIRDRDLAVDDQLAIMASFGEIVDEGGDGRRHVFVSNTRDD